nr:hypothetical protein [Tanacetum cinerariifolium]
TFVVVPAMAMKKPEVTTFEEHQKKSLSKTMVPKKEKTPPASVPTKSGGDKQKKKI